MTSPPRRSDTARDPLLRMFRRTEYLLTALLIASLLLLALAAEAWRSVTVVLLLGVLLALCCVYVLQRQGRAAVEERLRGQDRLLGFNRMLADVSQMMAAAKGDAGLLQGVSEAIVARCDMQLVLFLRPDESGSFRFLAAAGNTGYLEGLQISTDPDLPEGRGPVGRSWREERIFYHQSLRGSSDLAPWQERAARFNLASVATLPIHRGQRIHAVLAAYHTAPDAFDEALRSLLPSLAKIISDGLDRIDLQAEEQRVKAELESLAFRDPHTDLPNRYAFEQRLRQALARTDARAGALAVGVIDLDDFESFNNRHGPAAGDGLLRVVANRLRAALPEPHFLGRLGGDEFVLMLQLPEREGAQAALTPLLETLGEALHLPLPDGGGGETRLCMSLGLALYNGPATERDSLFRAAQSALTELKAKKLTRSSWWHLAGQRLAEEAAPVTVAPYGEAAAALLRPLAAPLLPAIEAEIPHQMALLASMPQSLALMGNLTAQESAALIASLRSHFQMLTRPELTEEAQRAAGHRLGAIHALTGAPSADTYRLLDRFAAMLREVVDEAPLATAQRLQLQLVLQARLSNELQYEQQGRWQVDIERQASLAQIQQSAEAWFAAGSFASELVLAMSGLAGIRGASWGRPNDRNIYVVEFTGGCASDFLKEVAEQGVSLQFGTRDIAQETTALRAWGSGRIEVTDNIATDPRLAAFAPVAARFGVRSSAAIPVRDETGLPVAVMTLLGAYPGQFSTQLSGIWLWALQEIMQRGRSTAASGQAPISVERRRGLRNALYGDGLHMMMQPVVELRSGRLVLVEALARLSMEDRLVAPGEFLPAFGAQELQVLFRRGLEQSLGHIGRFGAWLPGLKLGINLPPVVLDAPDCTTWISETLARFGITTNRLCLELLELEETRQWKERASVTLRELSARGVHLAMDDLGSGYSGLQRLRTLPFNKVKIDQNLIRQALTDPQNTIPFIGGLIQVAHRLGMIVVAEGLESDDLVEMVAILGADYGQGYALARPMPPEALQEWAAGFNYAVDHARPRTALGLRALREREKDRSLAALS